MVATAGWAFFVLFFAGGSAFGFASVPDTGAKVFLLAYCVLLLVLAASQSMELAARWRHRKTPLVVEDSGRVTYDGQAVCADASVRSVAVAVAHVSKSEEYYYYTVSLRLADRLTVELPGPYYDQFNSKRRAYPFAQELASALGVRAVYTDRYGYLIRPKPNQETA